MDYTQEQLKKIEQLAAMLTPVSEISVLLELKNEDMLSLDIATHGHPARMAYLRGMASTASELREKNLQLARACSPSAMEQCIHDLQNMMLSL